MKRKRVILGYLLAGVAMLLLFLYLRFPGAAVKEFVLAEAARYPGVVLSIGAIGPAIPPGVMAENLSAALRGRPEATLRADRISIRPGWLALFRGRFGLSAVAAAYGGDLDGTAQFVNPLSFTGPLLASLKLQGIRVERCAWLREALTGQVTGTLRGWATFSGTANSPRRGAADIDLTLTNGNYKLAESLLGFDQIDFSRVDAKANLRNGALRIAGLTLMGEKIRISLKGNVLLAENLRQSQLDLVGSIELPGQGNRRMNLAINGTLDNPKMRFL